MAYSSIVSDHVHPFMATIYSSSNNCFQKDNVPYQKVISNCFHEHDNEFSALQWSPRSTDLNVTEHLWDVMEHEILQHQCAANKCAGKM